jgi:hypothetical protein
MLCLRCGDFGVRGVRGVRGDVKVLGVIDVYVPSNVLFVGAAVAAVYPKFVFILSSSVSILCDWATLVIALSRHFTFQTKLVNCEKREESYAFASLSCHQGTNSLSNHSSPS